MWFMAFSSCGWLAPLPLPLAAPARVSRGEARPSSPLPCRVPHAWPGRRRRPLSWGRHPLEGGGGSGKNGKGPEKRLVLLADGHVGCRLLGPLRIPPLARLVPPTHAEHTLAGVHPSCSACTRGPKGYLLPKGARDECRWSRAHLCGLERPNPKENYPIHKTRKRENTRYDQLLLKMHSAFLPISSQYVT